MTTDVYPRPNLVRANEEALAPHQNGVVIHRGSEASQPALSMPGETSDDTVRVLVDGDDTRGLAAVIEYTIAPLGDGPGLHWHRTFDEYFYVVSGTLSMRAAAQHGKFSSRDFVFVPRGVIHDFWNDSPDTPCIFVSGWTPAGSERVWDLDDLPNDSRTDPELFQAAVASRIDAVHVGAPGHR